MGSRTHPERASRSRQAPIWHCRLAGVRSARHRKFRPGNINSRIRRLLLTRGGFTVFRRRELTGPGGVNCCVCRRNATEPVTLSGGGAKNFPHRQRHEEKATVSSLLSKQPKPQFLNKNNPLGARPAPQFLHNKSPARRPRIRLSPSIAPKGRYPLDSFSRPHGAAPHGATVDS